MLAVRVQEAADFLPEGQVVRAQVDLAVDPFTDALDPLEFVRTIAVARILMPQSHVRLSAGRTEMSDELQSLCFFAGANSMFYGERLLTTDNPGADTDQALFERLGIRMEQTELEADQQVCCGP